MNKKILIIEDDAALAQVYSDLFKPHNVNIVSANTGKSGLEQIESEHPDLVILDIMLPGGMNGFDVLEGIEANPKTKQIPVIVLSNLDSEEHVAKVIGAKKYLVKANTTTQEVVQAALSYLS